MNTTNLFTIAVVFAAGVGAVVRLERKGSASTAVLRSGAVARVSRRDYAELRKRLVALGCDVQED